MGRSGAKGSRPRPDAIDLGIPNDAAGISRRHLEVVRVCNLDPTPSGQPQQPSQGSQLSQRSCGASVSSGTGRRRPPYASE